LSHVLDYSPCSDTAPCLGAEAVDDFDDGDIDETPSLTQLRHIVIDGSNLAMRYFFLFLNN
jgi:hypothetical protein